MSTFQTPGVYVLDVPPAARPITGVGTSTAAFLGVAGVPPDAMPEHPSSPQVFNAGQITYKAANKQVVLAGATWPRFSGKAKLKIDQGEFPASWESDTTLILPEKAPGADIAAPIAYELTIPIYYPQADPGKPYLVTNWEEFKFRFGDFRRPSAATPTSPATPGNQYLAHAVYGFFANGGTRCYAVRLADLKGPTIDSALGQLATINEVSIVAAPLAPDTPAQDRDDMYGKLLTHCELQKDRFAILDSPDTSESEISLPQLSVPNRSPDGYGAYYFPWLVVKDPLAKQTSSAIHVPPCGHIAGIYARTDASRGVCKAPANESVQGIQRLAFPVTNAHQDELNSNNVNCIRSFYGNPLVWGARTVATKAEYRYVNVRRFLIFLRESIIQGVNWAVFEPNNRALWKRITRSVGDFLLSQWRDGALLGDSPQQAFYVRCDETTNPSDVREQGQVVTEVGVAIVKPAEFVIFRIQQQTGG